MRKKTNIILLLLMVGIISLLFLLLNFAHLANEAPNGFNRVWKQVSVSPLIVTATETPLEEIVGLTNHHIFFTVPNPQWLIMMDLNFSKEDTLGFGLRITKDMLGVSNTHVDSPYVYFFANNVPAIYKGEVGKWQLDSFKIPTNAFTRSDKITANSAVFRVLASNLQKQTFQVINLLTGEIERQSEIINDQKPGGFESDGWLHFDSSTNHIYYVEYYRNRFYCIDTSLQLIYTGRTIDTVDNNDLTVKRTKIDGVDKIMPAKPRIRVNRYCYAAQEYLFNISALKADNETVKEFRTNVVFDLYKLKNGNYAGSFRVPIPDGDILKSFTVKNNMLVILFKKHIARYQIHSN